MSEASTTGRAERPCTLCGAAGTPLFAAVHDRLFGAEGEYAFVRCVPCDHVWLQPLPSDLAALYDGYYTHAEHVAETWTQRMIRLTKRGEAARAGYRGMASRSERLLGALASRLRPLREAGELARMGLEGADERAPARRLLDVGCGDGTLLAHMHSLGWKVSGVETDPEAGAVARGRIGKVHTGELADAPFPDGHFDAITLSHVIEHLPDPGAVLARCRALLAPGGRLAVATPNARSLGARHFGAHWIHWDPPRHLEVYSPKSLRRRLQAAGFWPLTLSTPCVGAAFSWQASQLIARDGGLPGVSAAGAGPLMRARALAALGREWAAVARDELVGEEILLIAEPDER